MKWKIYTKIYELDPAQFLSTPGLARQAALKLWSFNWYWYVIKGKKGISGGIRHSIYWYTKGNNKYLKDYDDNKELSCPHYWEKNELYGWTM